MAYHDYVLPVPQRGYNPFAYWSIADVPAADTTRIFASGYERQKPHIWEIYFWTTILTTDANVANRYIRHRVRGEAFSRDSVKSGAVPASTTVKFKWSHILHYTANPSDDADALGLAMDYFLILGNEYIESYIDNEQAGDKYNVSVQARYRSYDMGIFTDPSELTIREFDYERHTKGYWNPTLDPRYK